jgi:hypothetical protein
MKLKIQGIYNSELLRIVTEKDVCDVVFDFRPRSFNFIQLYKVEEILKEYQGDLLSLNVCLLFSSEKDFVIKKALEDISKIVPKDNLFLEFDDLSEGSFYNQFKTPFICHYYDSLNLAELSKQENLDTLKIANDIIQRLEIEGKLFAKLTEISEISKKEDFKIELELNWNSSISESIFDFFDIAKVSFSINSLIEKSYRQVDIDLFINQLIQVKSSLAIKNEPIEIKEIKEENENTSI